jgi:hypothetical protein
MMSGFLGTGNRTRARQSRFTQKAQWLLQDTVAQCLAFETRYAVVFDGHLITLKVFRDLVLTQSTHNLDSGNEVVLGIMDITQTPTGEILTTIAGFIREALAAAIERLPVEVKVEGESKLEELLKDKGL